MKKESDFRLPHYYIHIYCFFLLFIYVKIQFLITKQMRMTIKLVLPLSLYTRYDENNVNKNL